MVLEAPTVEIALFRTVDVPLPVLAVSWMSLYSSPLLLALNVVMQLLVLMVRLHVYLVERAGGPPPEDIGHRAARLELDRRQEPITGESVVQG